MYKDLRAVTLNCCLQLSPPLSPRPSGPSHPTSFQAPPNQPDLLLLRSYPRAPPCPPSPAPSGNSTSWGSPESLPVHTTSATAPITWWTCSCLLLQGSVQFSHSVMSDSLQPCGLQHARPPCPSPTPRVYSNSCPLSR